MEMVVMELRVLERKCRLEIALRKLLEYGSTSRVFQRRQHIRLKDIMSDTVVSSTGAPQGTVLAPLLFTPYTSDFCYNSVIFRNMPVYQG
ncbi:hypothetical protein D4764_20G0009080 [Takifugu flavidus]|uniref:Reverse transcriptase domain-containing protein n=1 Tax=Takifugu flavidus TaxID=433684 RepID=A0A5C6NIF7_9TELE|nr:hypothetical protein D4764_20G0009080 [Takifugu flavidus]